MGAKPRQAERELNSGRRGRTDDRNSAVDAPGDAGQQAQQVDKTGGMAKAPAPSTENASRLATHPNAMSVAMRRPHPLAGVMRGCHIRAPALRSEALFLSLVADPALRSCFD